MKTAKIIIISLSILIIVASGYVAVQPNWYDIKRSRVIKAPAELLFNQVNDYKNWKNWSPWVEKEPELQITYPEKTSGVGGSYSWVGKDGAGNMKTLAASSFDSISQEMQFEDFPPSNVYWKFENIDQGTKVTWGMKANQVPFLLKFFAVINGGMDNMVGPDYERGLEKLDSLTVESMKKFNITINGITEYGGGFYLYKTTNATNDNISTTMAQQYASIGTFMAKNNISMNGMPLTVYQDMNMDEGTVIMSNGIPVSEKITITDNSGVLSGYIPKTKVLKTTLKGNYSYLSKAWAQSMKYLLENNLEQSDIKPFEIYTNDPGNFPNPANWVTEIYIPLADN